MSLGCFVNNRWPIWCQGSIRCLATWRGGCSCSPLFVFFDVGSWQAYIVCVCACMSLCLSFSTDSILLDFWAQSTVHMVLSALWMANASVIVRPIGRDHSEFQEQAEECVKKRVQAAGIETKALMTLTKVTFSLLSTAILIQVLDLKFMQADQEWEISAVDKLTNMSTAPSTHTWSLSPDYRHQM